MAIFSKEFYIQNVGKTCADYTHPGITCEHFSFTTFRDGWLGGIQFYLPSIVIPALFKWDRWSVPFWTKVFKDYVRSIFFGACMMIFVGYGSFCLFYEFIRRHHKIFVFFPCMLGSLFGYFMPAHVLEIQTIGAINMAADYTLRSSRSPVVQYLRKSALFTTFLFMVSTGIISRVQSRGLIRRYWFLKVDQRTTTSANRECVEKDTSVWMNKLCKREFKICSHAHSCDRHILTEMRQTALLSFLLALANFLALQSKKLKGNWGSFPVIFSKYFDYGFFFFLILYNGTYRFMNCLLNRRTNEDSISNSMIAATLSGLSFLMYRRYLMLAFACFRAVQLYGNEKMLVNKDSNEFYRKMDKIPFNWIFYTLSTAYTYQSRVFYPDICPTYVHQTMRIGTARRSDTLTERYTGILMGLL